VLTVAGANPEVVAGSGERVTTERVKPAPRVPSVERALKRLRLRLLLSVALLQ